MAAVPPVVLAGVDLAEAGEEVGILAVDLCGLDALVLDFFSVNPAGGVGGRMAGSRHA